MVNRCILCPFICCRNNHITEALSYFNRRVRAFPARWFTTELTRAYKLQITTTRDMSLLVGLGTTPSSTQHMTHMHPSSHKAHNTLLRVARNYAVVDCLSLPS